MSNYTQHNRPLQIHSSLPENSLLVQRIRGRESLSRVFQYRVDLLAPKPIEFKKLLGEEVSLRIAVPGSPARWLHGLVQSLVLLGRVRDGDQVLHRYRAHVVPRLWLWSQRVRSRIFQGLSTPEILREVLQGIDTAYHLTETYYPRNYCTQYQESDLNFLCRIMEDDGISFFFDHSQGSSRLILTDNPYRFHDLDEMSTVRFDDSTGGLRDACRVTQWSKAQRLRSGKYSVADFWFEMPRHFLSAHQALQPKVQVGSAHHESLPPICQDLEVEDPDTAYAHRFDSVAKDGGEQPVQLTHVYDDQTRLARLRSEEALCRTLGTQGRGSCGHFRPGSRFTMTDSPEGNGSYVLTSVEIHASQAQGWRSEDSEHFDFRMRFSALPENIPYRPRRSTPRPRVQGTQTAVVVGLSELDKDTEKIFCDKYGRVKVHFAWDRRSSWNAESSCWLRVAQMMSGQGFGTMMIPRVGQEVIVDFLDGDPDQPIVIGTVYNAMQTPPLPLPAYANHSGFRSRTLQGKSGNYHEVRFDDTPGKETLRIHAENHLHSYAEKKQSQYVGFGAASTSNTTNEKPSSDSSSDDSGTPNWVRAIKGHGFKGIWGNNGELIFGDNIEFVLGENVDVTLGIDTELKIGADIETTVGLDLEFKIGPEITWHNGPTIDWQSGNRYEKTDGDVLEIINGDGIEIVNKGKLIFVVNGWVTELLDSTELPAIDKTLLSNLATQLEHAGGPAAVMAGAFTPLPALPNPASTALLRDVGSLAENNPIKMKEACSEFLSLVYNDCNLISNKGDIMIMCMGEGKKLVLQADTIELRANNVNTFSTANPNNVVQDEAIVMIPNYLKAAQMKADLELSFVKETMEVMEKETSSALGFAAGAGYWTTFILLMLVLIAATTSFAAVAQSEGKGGDED